MGDQADSSMPQWKGLFDWSMSYHDGTTMSDFENCGKPDPEKLKWLEHVLSNYMVDFAKKMTDMMGTLEDAASGTEQKDTVAQASALLEELHDIVESIDFARDLRSIGGLPVLKLLLGCGSSDLRWRAADVVAACAQNNIAGQEWMVQESIIDVCKPLLRKPEVMDRRKGLLAISAIVRGYTPGMVIVLKDPELMSSVLAQASDEEVRTRRKAIEMARTVCREAPQAKLTITSSAGFLDSLASSVSHEDTSVLSSALGLLHELVDDQQALAILVDNRSLVDAFMNSHSKLMKLTGEDKEAMLEELEMAKTVAEYLT